MGSMLTLQTTTGAEATMSSREIAELTGKEHRNVMADIRVMLDQLGIEHAEFSARYLAGNNQEQPMFVLPKELTLTLVSGYSVAMRKAIIDRWMALESAAFAPAIPQSFAAALRLAAEQQDVIDAQAAQLAAAAPAVEFVERYADSTGTKGFRQVAKLLGAKENLFREFLIDQKILYRLGTELTPHAQHIDAGRFCVKAGTAETGHAFNSARFTPKGVTWIAGEWAKHQVALRQKGGQHAA